MRDESSSWEQGTSRPQVRISLRTATEEARNILLRSSRVPRDHMRRAICMPLFLAFAQACKRLRGQPRRRDWPRGLWACVGGGTLVEGWHRRLLLGGWGCELSGWATVAAVRLCLVRRGSQTESWEAEDVGLPGGGEGPRGEMGRRASVGKVGTGGGGGPEGLRGWLADGRMLDVMAARGAIKRTLGDDCASMEIGGGPGTDCGAGTGWFGASGELAEPSKRGCWWGAGGRGESGL